MNRGAVGLAGLVLAFSCATPYEGTESDDDANEADGGSKSDSSTPPAPPGGDASTSSSGGQSSSSGALPGYEMTPDETTMFDAVNAARAAATDASPALNPVVWDVEASLELRQWVSGCTMPAPTTPGATTTLYGSAAGTFTPASLMQRLVDARAYYTRADNSCAQPREVCETYTNLVQRGVSRIACAWGAECPAPPPGSSSSEAWRKWICRLAPLPDPAAAPY